MALRTRLLAVALTLGGLGLAVALLWPAERLSAPTPAVTSRSPPRRPPQAEAPRFEPLFHSDQEDQLRKPPIALAARFVRGEDEWQGMLPDPEEIWPCMPDGTCSKARACVDGQCVPCTSDGECQRSE